MSNLIWLMVLFGIWLIPYLILSQQLKKSCNTQKTLIARIELLEQKIQFQQTNAPLHPDKEQPDSPKDAALHPPNHVTTIQSDQPPQLAISHLPAVPLAVTRPSPSPLEPDERSQSVVTSVWISLIRWFSGGNTIVRVGVFILLIGVGLLLRLLNDMVQIPIGAWLCLIATAASLLVGLGLRLVDTRRGYALSLQGAGLATLYLTLFSAYRLYEILPSQITFALLAILATVTTVLSLRQDALPLAVLGFGGAFFAPILTSTEQGQVILLFSYYLLINLALAWIAHRRTWKILNLLGASATFGMAALWGWQAFDPAIRWPMEILLIAHVVLYMFMVVRYSQLLAKQPAVTTNQQTNPALLDVDTGLLFGVPLFAFGLQAGLLHDVPYALAVSSAVLAALYLGLVYWLKQQALALPLLREGILALGLGFLALIVPLALDAQWTSTGWLIQGVALVWVGVRQTRVWQVRFGLGLQAISLLILLWLWLADPDQGIWLELLVAFSALLLSAVCMRQSAQQVCVSPITPKIGSTVLIIVSYGVAVWLLQDRWSALDQISTWRLATTATQLLWDGVLLLTLGLLLSMRMVWVEMRWVIRRFSLMIGGLLLCAVWQGVVDESSAQPSLLVASIAWLSLQLLIWRHLAIRDPDQTLQQDQAIGLAVVLALLSLWSFEFFPNAAALMLLPIGLLLLLQTTRVRQVLPSWLIVVRSQQDLYVPLACGLSIWMVWANLQSTGQFGVLPYLPLLNLLDGCLIAVSVWLYRGLYTALPQYHDTGRLLLGGLLFWSLSGVVVRSLHQWLDTPLWPQAWQNDTVQASLTIVWSISALLITVLASRYAWRAFWWVGIGLLVMVTAKLLLVDLSNLSAMARVISFIGAGGLMLVIGYVAPLPPESAAEATRPE